ncbi:MAG TPA: helix-hairpin-helix domain-containing protein [Vicinamibacterales bacterium]
MLDVLSARRRCEVPAAAVIRRLVPITMLVLLTLSVPALAQQLPDAPGKDAVVKLCGTCHPAERGASVRLTREGWEDVITRMVALGLKATDDELNVVLDYLSTHFEGEAVAPLNLNRATPVQLQSVAGMLRSESAAWVAYRAKKPCTSLEDLKEVPGVDFKRIEKRRDRLVCF